MKGKFCCKSYYATKLVTMYIARHSRGNQKKYKIFHQFRKVVGTFTTRKKRNNYIQQIQRFSTSYNTIIIQCTWYNNHLFSFVANPNVRQNLPFIVHETVYGAIQVLQQASFSFSRNTNFATKIADNKIRPLFCNKKTPPF